MAEKKVRNQPQEEKEKISGMDINTDENISGSTHLNEPVDEESAIEKLKMELAEAQDKYLRKVAEFDNFRKRNAKERLELIQTAGKEVIVQLLEVLDDCDRAEKQLQAAGEKDSVIQGVQLVFNKLRSTLQGRGLQPMNAVGADFDADKHEAITEIPAPSADMKGKVVDELEKGYY